MTKGRTVLHSEPTDLPNNASRDAALVEFGRRMQKGMIAKGWNQSELARRANGHMSNGDVTRAHISKYATGAVLPSPARLHAIAKALDMEPEELVPTRGVTARSEKAPALDMRDSGDGNVWLRMNQQVPWTKALKILEILKGE